VRERENENENENDHVNKFCSKFFAQAPQEILKEMEACARALAKSVQYVGAATVEYLYDLETGRYFFLELNPRLQVRSKPTAPPPPDPPPPPRNPLNFVQRRGGNKGIAPAVS
jgi:hypothetical protein